MIGIYTKQKLTMDRIETNLADAKSAASMPLHALKSLTKKTFDNRNKLRWSNSMITKLKTTLETVNKDHYKDAIAELESALSTAAADLVRAEAMIVEAKAIKPKAPTFASTDPTWISSENIKQISAAIDAFWELVP